MGEAINSSIVKIVFVTSLCPRHHTLSGFIQSPKESARFSVSSPVPLLVFRAVFGLSNSIMLGAVFTDVISSRRSIISCRAVRLGTAAHSFSRFLDSESSLAYARCGSFTVNENVLSSAGSMADIVFVLFCIAL